MTQKDYDDMFYSLWDALCKTIALTEDPNLRHVWSDTAMSCLTLLNYTSSNVTGGAHDRYVRALCMRYGYNADTCEWEDETCGS